MKTQARLFAKIALVLTVITLLIAVPRASAVPVTFSGGSGTPLSFSLAAPISYTVIAPPTASAPFFVFQNTGNLSFSSPISGSITFLINSGPAQTLSIAVSGDASGLVTGNDLFFYGPFLPLNIGDIVTLTAGTWTTNNAVIAAAPASGSYTTFITDNLGILVSANGVSGSAGVPEILSTLWLAFPLALMFVVRRRITASGR